MEEFVFGTKEAASLPTPPFVVSSAPTPTASLTPFALLPVATLPPPFASAPQPVPLQSKEPSLMSKLQAPDKEPMVRFTVDMSESLRRKLSMLAAKTGRKKVDPSVGAVAGWAQGSGWIGAIGLLPQRIDISKVYRTDAGTHHILFASVLSFMRQTANFQLLCPKTVD
jgi:hypothetical protein